MNPASTAVPVLQRLKKVVVEGRKLSTKPGTEVAISIWIMSARTALGDIYGRDTAEVDLRCPQPNADPANMRPEARLSRRLQSIECLTERLTFSPQAARIFIGHGQSPVWRELKDFLADRLSLPWEEFNREAVAGITTSERLHSMLANANFAVLVMTPEDEHADSTLHARENVIHEVGLFQGRLGPRRAIVLLEEGCHDFSNIHGLSHISFPQGRVSAAFEDIRRVLEREGVIGS